MPNLDYQIRPIEFHYAKPSLEMIEELKQQDERVAITSEPGFKLANIYYQLNYPGTNRTIYTRKSILESLKKIRDLIAPHYGIYIFDAFRTLQTQKHLFDLFFEQIRQHHPDKPDEWLQIEVRKYVSHPHEPSRFAVPPHNSGGAIDLAFFDLRTGELLDYGADFDEIEAISGTDYFEQAVISAHDISDDRWQLIRNNRRFLFHVMTQFGFTNYETEWWHYDLGDCLWAQKLGLDYIYPSMEM